MCMHQDSENYLLIGGFWAVETGLLLLFSKQTCFKKTSFSKNHLTVPWLSFRPTHLLMFTLMVKW